MSAEILAFAAALALAAAPALPAGRAGARLAIFSPSLFSWSTKLSTSLDLPPNLSALRETGFLQREY